MKITFYILIFVGLALPISLHAQDAPTRPLRDPASDIEPTPLPRSSSTPTSTPRTTPHKVESPVPEPSPPSTPEPSQQPTPTATPERPPAKPEQTAVKATPRSAPVKTRAQIKQKSPAPPQADATPRSRPDTRTVAAKLKAMEQEWEASFNVPAVIEKLLANDFVGTSPGGKIMTKKALLSEARQNPVPALKTLAHHLEVHFYGADLAIVTGASKQFDNSGGLAHNYRFTDTWVERDGNWQCVASQTMLLPRR